MARIALKQLGQGRAETDRPKVVVHVPAGEEQHLGALTPAWLARFACDSIVEAVNPDKLILGHAVRTATAAQRRFLAARDGGCVIPGCHAPPGWTDAHHVDWWSTGGATDVTNLALVCGRHHADVHSGGGFKWSSQHLSDLGSCGGASQEWAAEVGVVGVAVGAAGVAAGVLAAGRAGVADAGGGCGVWRVGGGGGVGGFVRLEGCHLILWSRRGVICRSSSGRRSPFCTRRMLVWREIARQLGRAPSTISRELERNAGTRSYTKTYRASTAQWHCERRARRPKTSKLAANERLRGYVQAKLAGEGEGPPPRPDWRKRWRGGKWADHWQGRWSRSRSPAAERWTSPTMRTCGSLTRRSTRRCTCRAAVSCAGN